jgi:hypothetical protein
MPTAVVTGASSGLGLELARGLSAQGYDLVLVARSEGPLNLLATELGGATVVAADLSKRRGVDAVLEAAPDVDLLVNNAGFGEAGLFADSDPRTSTDMVRVNCEALVGLTRAYLPGMLARGQGQILNVASTAAFQPGPEMAVYYASKAFVLSFTEAIAEELRGSGVRALAFCPGAFTSGFQATAGLNRSWMIRGRKLPDSRQTAAQALAALESGDVVAVPGVVNKVGAFLPRITPRPVLRRAVHFIQREPGGDSAKKSK